MSELKPAIILVRPQLGENIGKAARAMLNFELDELRLVNPRDGWPNPDAGPSAAGADVVLDGAIVFDSLESAVADCRRVYATTVRKRGMMKTVVTAEQAAREVRGIEGKCAIVFGPERSGLETDEVALADAILTVPVNPGFGSLNLAQAVILFAYEWFKTADQTPPVRLEGDREGPATHEEIEGLIGQMDEALEKAGYYFPESRAPSLRRTVRNILNRPGYTRQEVRTLRGIVKALTGSKGQAG